MVTGLYAGLCGLLLVVLYARVSQRRIATKIGVGTGGDGELEQRVRAHANLIETAPMVLLMLLLVEQGGASPAQVHAFGSFFFAARLGHAYGLSKTTNRSAGRLLGSIGTVLVMAALAGWLLLDAVPR